MGKISKRITGLETRLVDKIIKQALIEDRVKNDITYKLLFSQDETVKAEIIAKEKGVIAGLDIVKRVFYLLDKKIKFQKYTFDGNWIRKGERVAILEGSFKNILAGERTALNFLMRLSGIATLTKKFVKKVYPYKVKIFDTRKTTPGLRILEKYAVRIGGGFNHRMNLSEAILIKDNYLREIKNLSTFRLCPKDSDIKNLIFEIRKKIPKDIKIEIEVKNLKEFKEVLKARPDIIMLDNIDYQKVKEAVRIRNEFSKSKFPELEVSGGISLENVRKFASTGVERISIGCLTHSYNSIDFSLEIL